MSKQRLQFTGKVDKQSVTVVTDGGDRLGDERTQPQVSPIAQRLRHVIGDRPFTWVAGGVVTGVILGLVVLGWWLWPVQYIPPPVDVGTLPDWQQAIYVRATADLLSFTQDSDRARAAMEFWNGVPTACRLAGQTADVYERMRLEHLAWVVNGVGCNEQGRTE